MIGANGACKTTLFRMIVGDETPDGGELRVGETVSLAYVDQSRDALDDEKSVWEEISDGQEEIEVGAMRMNSRAYAGGFNFKGSDQQRKVGTLSGGERNRLHLAKLLKSGGNVLLLDEPTNDLDVDTLRALEEALLEFAGCAVVISHDRWFLDRVATHVLAFEGDSQVRWFEGNFEAYEEFRHKELGAEATTARTGSPTRSSFATSPCGSRRRSAESDLVAVGVPVDLLTDSVRVRLPLIGLQPASSDLGDPPVEVLAEQRDDSVPVPALVLDDVDRSPLPQPPHRFGVVREERWLAQQLRVPGERRIEIADADPGEQLEIHVRAPAPLSPAASSGCGASGRCRRGP